MTKYKFSAKKVTGELKLIINNFEIFVRVYNKSHQFQIVRYDFVNSKILDYFCNISDYFSTYDINSKIPYHYSFDINNNEYTLNGYDLWINDETNSLCYESNKQVLFFAKFDDLEQYILFTKMVYKFIKMCDKRYVK